MYTEYKSFVITEDGSPFISAVTEVFAEHACRRDVLGLATMVRID